MNTRVSMNLSTLAGILDVAPSTTGRMVDRLVSAGLIDRHPHPDSRRELVAELFPRGRSVMRTLTAFTTAGGEPAAHLDEVGGYL
jgi:DNA-binding MarR family transcriptional regulator